MYGMLVNDDLGMRMSFFRNIIPCTSFSFLLFRSRTIFLHTFSKEIFETDLTWLLKIACFLAQVDNVD